MSDTLPKNAKGRALWPGPATRLEPDVALERLRDLLARTWYDKDYVDLTPKELQRLREDLGCEDA